MHFLFTLQAIKSHWVTCSDPRLLSGLPSASTRVNPKLLSTLQKFLYKIVHFNHKKPWLFSKHFINKPNTSFFRQKNLNCKKCKNNNNLGRFWEENVPEKKKQTKNHKGVCIQPTAWSVSQTFQFQGSNPRYQEVSVNSKQLCWPFRAYFRIRLLKLWP